MRVVRPDHIQPGSTASGASAADVTGPATLPGTAQFDLASAHTGRDYRILVSVPTAPPPPAGWPVAWLLDGNLLFPTAHTLARIGERIAERRRLTPAAPLLVAIGHSRGEALYDPARGQDCTPPTPDLSDLGDRRFDGQGGADRFGDFIEHELKPLIQGRYRIDPCRQALLGHSYGGLFTLYTLFTRPAAFQTWVAGSPSVWWNRRHLLTVLDAFAARAAHERVAARVLVTVGELEQTPTPAVDDPARARILRERRMVDNASELAARLATLPPEAGLDVDFRVVPDAGHLDAALPMLIAAFGRFWQPVPASG